MISDWYMISDKLPPVCENVLVYFERDAWIDHVDHPIRKRCIEVGWRASSGYWNVDGCSEVVAIAWMPLPEAPGPLGYLKGETKYVDRN